MIKTEKLSMLFTTEEVQTKALNEVTMQVERGICSYHGSFRVWQVYSAEYPGYTRFTHFRFLLLRRQTGGQDEREPTDGPA